MATINSDEQRQIDILISNRCQEYCRQCYCYGSEKGYRISDDELTKVTEFLRNNDYNVYYLAGESFMDDNAERILSSGQTYLFTNGLLIDRLPQLAQRFQNLNMLIFSLHGFAESHEYLTRTLSTWDAIVNNIRKAKNIVEDIHVNCVTYDRNIEEIPRFCDLIVDLGVSTVYFPLLLPVGRARSMDRKEFLTPEKMLRRIQLVEDQRNRYSREILNIRHTRGSGCGPSRPENVFRSHVITTENSFPSKYGTGYCPSSKERYMVAVRRSEGIYKLYSCFMMIENAFEVGMINLNTETITLRNHHFSEIPKNLEGICNSASCELNMVCQGGCRASAIAFHRLGNGDLNYYAEQPNCIFTLRQTIDV